VTSPATRWKCERRACTFRYSCPQRGPRLQRGCVCASWARTPERSSSTGRTSSDWDRRGAPTQGRGGRLHLAKEISMRFTATLVAAICLVSQAQEGSADGPTANAGAPVETVLFPFDDYSIPFSKGVLLSLVTGRKTAGDNGTGADP